MARRILATILVATALLGAGIAWWVADLARPRHEAFIERRGALVAAVSEPVEQHPGGFISQGYTLRADTGLAIEVRVLRPATVAGPLPVVVLLGGQRTGRDAVRLLGDPGAVTMVALDYPYRGAKPIKSIAAFLRSLQDLRQALFDTPPAASLVLDWLEGMEWADTSSAELVGVSFGVPFAAVAGGLDPRFDRVWLIHGGAGNRGWIEHNLRHRIESSWLRRLSATLIHLLVYGNSFETEEWVARIAPRPVVVIGARDDERLPEHKVQALYEAAGQPKELLWTAGGHIDTDRPELVRALLQIVRGRMEQERGDAPRDPAETP